jgi:methionyl-tRNA formyltransferase
MPENMQNNYRIIVLLGSSLPNLNTLSTLLAGNLNVVGAVIANQKELGINTKFLKIAVRKQGFFKVVLQIAERLIYKLINSKKDKKQFENIFNRDEIFKMTDAFKENIIHTFSYDTTETLDWIKSKNPNLIVIHTSYWVSKKVRNIVNGNVIGAHPGITQFYRGVHSPFWAIYNGDLDNIGYSIFWVDSGVDSGDLIFQGKIIPVKEDSYISLSWKGMAASASNIQRILNETENIDQIPRIKNTKLTKDTIFYHPTIFNYFSYLIKDKFR